MSEKNIPMLVEKDNDLVQVGWATAPDEDGRRAVNLFEQYNHTVIEDVVFDDDGSFQTHLDPETTQAPVRTYEDSTEPVVDLNGDPVFGDVIPVEPEVPVSEEASLPAEPEESAPDAELAAEPVENAPDEDWDAEPTPAGGDNEQSQEDPV